MGDLWINQLGSNLTTNLAMTYFIQNAPKDTYNITEKTILFILHRKEYYPRVCPFGCYECFMMPTPRGP